MKFVILNTDYPEFLRWLYGQHPGLEKEPYREQVGARAKSLFGLADFYSSNLQKLGHSAWDIWANNEFLQKAWAMEQGMQVEEPTPMLEMGKRPLRRVRRAAALTPLRYLKPLFRPVLRSLDRKPKWFYDVLAARIRHHKPDILLNQNVASISASFLREMKPYVRLLVAQHAATRLSTARDFDCYDLAVSSFPPTLEWFREEGIPVELHRLGFEPRILNYLNGDQKSIPISFVGSFGNVHSSRAQLLERLCAQSDVKVWAPTVKHLDADSPIRKSYMEPAWGLAMYRILCGSQITLNHHGDIAPYANNHRLYEATGVGTMLITDWKENLHEMFKPGKQVVAYHTPEECVELIQYYLEHDDERKAIARAGQQRTLEEHTYYHRMQELVDIVRKRL